MGQDVATRGTGRRLTCPRCAAPLNLDPAISHLVCPNCEAPLTPRGDERRTVKGDRVYYEGQPELHFTVVGVYVMRDDNGYEATWFVLDKGGEVHRTASHMVRRV